MRLRPSQQGLVYYLDAAGGNDSWPGTEAQPWKSLAKVNGSNFPAGATILLKRGATWTETLQPHNNGASGSPIIFGAYGTGPCR